MGKGSRARPFEVDTNQFADAWERTFGKKEVKEQDTTDNKEPEKEQSEKTK